MKKNISTFIIIVFIFMGLITESCTFKNKFEKEVEKEQRAVKLVREVQQGKYNIITASELKKWMDEGNQMLIVDTMPFESSYKKAHIPGAVQFLFPISEMKVWNNKDTDDKSIEDFKALLGSDINKSIIIYCGFVKCTRSHNGAIWTKKLGYKNVYRFSGGIYAWKGAKYPVKNVK
jgi:thiosulfate/3-mercaptopyruvate sulfurtransferase